MSKLDKIIEILGDPDRTYDDLSGTSHWWYDRTDEDYARVKNLGAEPCPPANKMSVRRGLIDINYVEK